MMIPLVDLKAQFTRISQEISVAIGEVLDSAEFIGGPQHAMFEKGFADYCEALGCVAVGNGTDALSLALRAAGIGPGDEVITVAHTFIATAEAITSTGARPVFADINRDTMLMDPAAVVAALSSRTRAVVPVHLYGQPCDMDAIMQIAGKHGLVVIEDAAQAHGATWRGRRAGSIGHAGCFSFYPGKNLGAYGDAGAVVSNNATFLDKIRMISNHGRRSKYLHDIEGVNSRMDNIQAAVLNVKLRYLEDWNEERCRLATAYAEALAGVDVELPHVLADAGHVWHLFVIRLRQRDALRRFLDDHGVSAGVHYPVPLHLQPAYRYLDIPRGSLPCTEEAAEEILSLPLFPELPQKDLLTVCELVKEQTGCHTRLLNSSRDE